MKVITIGRLEDNDVVINDPYATRHHLQIIRHDDGHYSLVDFGSTNGTFINGQKIRGEVDLYENDVVRIGNTTIPWRLYFEEGEHEVTEINIDSPPFDDIASIPSTPTMPIVKERHINNGQIQQSNDNDIKPDNYLGLAIVAAVFNLLFGVAAIICAVRVNKLWEKGEKERAEKASKNARHCSIWGLIFGVIGIIRICLRM